MKVYASVVAAIVTLLAMGVSGVRAQDALPAGNVTIVVPFAAGGPADSVARILAERFGARLNRRYIIENKGGAAGSIAAVQVAKSAPDGRTFLFAVDSIFTVNPHLQRSQGFARSDLVPAAQVGEVVLLLAVNPSKVKATDFKALVAESGVHEISFGSAGIGSPGHLAFEYLKQVSGIKGVHVPYRGAALVMQDLLTGNIDAAFIVSGVLVPHVKAGKIRALAVSAERKIDALPDVPTANAAGIKNFEASFRNFLMAPAKTDPKILAVYEKEILALEKDAAFIDRLKALSTAPAFGTGAQAAQVIEREYKRWGDVIAASGLKSR